MERLELIATVEEALTASSGKLIAALGVATGRGILTGASVRRAGGRDSLAGGVLRASTRGGAGVWG